jgi:hypothetical protein
VLRAWVSREPVNFGCPSKVSGRQLKCRAFDAGYAGVALVRDFPGTGEKGHPDRDRAVLSVAEAHAGNITKDMKICLKYQ